MSAAVQYRNFYVPSVRAISELELLRGIGSLTWSGSEIKRSLESLASLLLRFEGITAFRFEPQESHHHLPLFERSVDAGTYATANAVAAVAANSFHFGQARIFFHPDLTQTTESPLRLVRFVGQQLAILLHRIELQHEKNRQLASQFAMNRLLRRRKLLHRAAAIFAEQREVSDKEALSLLVQYARRNRRKLLDIAEALLVGHDSTALARPVIRRLTAGETTFQST